MKKISSFLLIVLLTITLTRIWAISLFYIFGNSGEFIEKIINDPYHHYQVGILLLALAYPLRKLLNSKIISAVGLGIFLEEWPVFLNDLGLNTSKYYHSKVDFLVIVGVIGFIYLLTLYSRKDSLPANS